MIKSKLVIFLALISCNLGMAYNRQHIKLTPVTASEIYNSLGSNPIQFAIPRLVDQNLLGARFLISKGQKSIWEVRLSAEFAKSLNFIFSKFVLNKHTTLSFLDYKSGNKLTRTFDYNDNDVHQRLASPLLESNDILIRIEETMVSKSVGYIPSILQLGRANIEFEAPKGKMGNCHTDVVCEEGENKPEQVKSSVKLIIGGVYLCSANMLNNTAHDGAPILLTAMHCGINVNQSDLIVAYFNFENSTCRQRNTRSNSLRGDGKLDKFISGAIFRASLIDTDFALVELDDPIPEDWGVYLAGWDARKTTHQGGYGIHHPRGNEKRISLTDKEMFHTTYGGYEAPGDWTHYIVKNWSVSATEKGSSGSALYNTDDRVIGQLHGGWGDCYKDKSHWYGSLPGSWDLSPEDNKSLKKWLDKANTGEMYIDGIYSNSGG